MFIELIPDPTWDGQRTLCVAVEHITAIKSTNRPNLTRIELINAYAVTKETYESFMARLNELTQKS